jgi:hypothetical protein
MEAVTGKFVAPDSLRVPMTIEVVPATDIPAVMSVEETSV